MRRFDLLEEAVRRAGARKVLFGSDGPWLHPGVELAKVRLLGLSAVDEARVTGKNVLTLLAAPRRRPPSAVVTSAPRVIPDEPDPWLAGVPPPG